MSLADRFREGSRGNDGGECPLKKYSSGCGDAGEPSVCVLLAKFRSILSKLEQVDFTSHASAGRASALYAELKGVLWQVDCSSCRSEVVAMLKSSEIISALRSLAQSAEEAHERMVAEVIYG